MTVTQLNNRLKKLEGKSPMSEAWQNLLCDVQEELENTREKINDLELRWELTDKQEQRLEELQDKEAELDRVFNSLDNGELPETVQL